MTERKDIKMVNLTENNLVMDAKEFAKFSKTVNLELTNDGVPDATLMKRLLSRVYYERPNNKKWSN